MLSTLGEIGPRHVQVFIRAKYNVIFEIVNKCRNRSLGKKEKINWQIAFILINQLFGTNI